MVELPFEIWDHIKTLSECILCLDDLIVKTEQSRVMMLYKAADPFGEGSHYEVLGSLRDVCKSKLLTFELLCRVKTWRRAESILNEYDGGPFAYHRERMRDEIDARLLGPIT